MTGCTCQQMSTVFDAFKLALVFVSTGRIALYAIDRLIDFAERKWRGF